MLLRGGKDNTSPVSVNALLYCSIPTLLLETLILSIGLIRKAIIYWPNWLEVEAFAEQFLTAEF